MTINNCPIDNAYSAQVSSGNLPEYTEALFCGETKECNERKKLYNLLSDPILAKLILDEKLNNDSEREGTVPNNAKGLGWMAIESTIDSGAYRPFYDKEELGQSVMDLDRKFSKFLIVKKYTEEQNKIIYSALKGGFDGGATAEQIVFDKFGNLLIKKSKSSTAQPEIMLNTLSRSDESWVRGLITDFEQNSLAGAAIKKFNIVYNNDKTHGAYYYEPRLLLNPTLNYILYSPDIDNDGIDPKQGVSNPKYFLLYNPIHSKYFKEYYSSLLKLDDMSNNNGAITGVVEAYSNHSQAAFHPMGSPTGCHITAPSFLKIMERYCNSLRVGRRHYKLWNRVYTEYYADPSCSIVLEKSMARLSRILNKNYSKHIIKHRFFDYTPRPDTLTPGEMNPKRLFPIQNDPGYNGYTENEQFLEVQSQAAGQVAYENSAWACPNRQGEGKGPINYIHDLILKAGHPMQQKNTFLYTFLNAYVFNTFKDQYVQEGPPPFEDVYNSKQLAACPQTTVNTTMCNINYYIGGAVSDESTVKAEQNCKQGEGGAGSTGFNEKFNKANIELPTQAPTQAAQITNAPTQAAQITNALTTAPPKPLFPGCTNPAAVNYNPVYTIDDGSCSIGGCTDPAAKNYNADATFFIPGSCDFVGIDSTPTPAPTQAAQTVQGPYLHVTPAPSPPSYQVYSEDKSKSVKINPIYIIIILIIILLSLAGFLFL